MIKPFDLALLAFLPFPGISFSQQQQQQQQQQLPIPHLSSFPSKRQQTIRSVLGSSYSSLSSLSSTAQSSLRIFQPSDFGCDPTGQIDASVCFDDTLKAFLGSAINASSTDMYSDLGGAVLDLSGGENAPFAICHLPSVTLPKTKPLDTRFLFFCHFF